MQSIRPPDAATLIRTRPPRSGGTMTKAGGADRLSVYSFIVIV
jgi:hypothetical protein